MPVVAQVFATLVQHKFSPARQKHQEIYLNVSK